MKLKSKITLNEAIAKIADTNQPITNLVFADAVRQTAINKEKAEEVIKMKKADMPNDDRFAHQKVNATKEMKKMKLAESLFTEWFDDEEDKGFVQPNLILKDGQFQFDDKTNSIIVAKNIFDDFMLNKRLNVQFIDDGQDVYCYEMISENNNTITMKYIGEGIPGIDEEVADCQRYPVEKPKAKDSVFISAEDKQPKDKVDAKDSTYISADDKQPEKAAMKEAFNNWDSPESRIERYETDLPELMNTMHDLYMNGRLEAKLYAEALKIAYDALDSVPSMDEALEDSQRYPIEKPEAKDSEFISKEDKQPATAVDAKDSQFISAGDKDPNKAFGEKKLGESLLTEDVIYKYKPTRDPLGEIIQVELTEGEWGYREENGKQTATRLPSANYRDDKIGANWDDEDKYAITVLGSTIDQLESAIKIAVKYNKEYKIEKLSRPIAGDTVRLWIYMDEEKDFDEPYKGESDIVDMSKIPAKVIYDKVDNKEASVEEAIESEQKYPIESPISEDLDIDVDDKLEEATISVIGAGNFNPNPGKAKETFDKIIAADKIGVFDFTLEELFPKGATANEVNELLEEKSDWVLNLLNIVDEAEEKSDADDFDAMLNFED